MLRNQVIHTNTRWATLPLAVLQDDTMLIPQFWWVVSTGRDACSWQCAQDSSQCVQLGYPNKKGKDENNNYYYYIANPVLSKSLCSDWFFLVQDFACFHGNVPTRVFLFWSEAGKFNGYNGSLMQWFGLVMSLVKVDYMKVKLPVP